MLVSGCKGQRAQEAGPPIPLRLAWANLHDCSLVQLAAAKGFFKEEGLAVQVQPCGYGKAALQAVLDGKADLATVAETPLMFAVLGGQKLSVIGSIYTSNKKNGIVARRKSGISAPGDLKNKRIAFTQGTTSHIFLSSFLTANHLAMDEVRLVDLPPEQMQEALLSGRVDAVSTWDPTGKIIAERMGADGVVLNDPHIYTETFVIAGHASFVNGNQEAMRRMLRALLRAEEFALRHPQEAQAIVFADLKLPPALVAELWEEGSCTVALDHALLLALEEETRWAAKHRLARNVRMPNFLEVIDPRPLLSVKPEAVDPQVLRP
ncbi:ABC transporter substrate-binding protein [Geomonas edaphica]|uniref:ABC transporter substrate-binding protein n=1 Tax=Geomonas edaphica TaxID=2570226 RepID=UPI00248230A9|nr:NrtA/SsuA/CpmA family ABC transporter substrate-binding protein [Geomonas edaphica]